MLLQNKTIIITGASRGIGKSCAHVFAKHGANLVLIARNKELLDSLKEDIEVEYNTAVSVFSVDVSDRSAVQTTFKELRKSKTPIDAIVNNAGIMIDATLQMTTTDIIDSIYSTNVYGSIYTAQEAMKLMFRSRRGSIVNLSSIIGTNGNTGQTIYGSSKSAIIGFTKSLSKELAPLNIRVNAIAPGFIDTDMTKGMDSKFYEKNVSSIGLGRIGTPEDVAHTALFLVSDLSEYVTGQVIGVDGGMII